AGQAIAPILKDLISISSQWVQGQSHAPMANCAKTAASSTRSELTKKPIASKDLIAQLSQKTLSFDPSPKKLFQRRNELYVLAHHLDAKRLLPEIIRFLNAQPSQSEIEAKIASLKLSSRGTPDG